MVNDATNALARVTATSYGVGRHLAAAGRKAFRGPYGDRRVRRAALAMLGDAPVADDYLRGVELALRTTLRDLPVLLVFGAKSPQMEEGFRERWTAIFPEARVLVVDGGHHFPMADDPGVVAGAIRSWWEDAVAAAGVGSPSEPVGATYA